MDSKTIGFNMRNWVDSAQGRPAAYDIETPGSVDS